MTRGGVALALVVGLAAGAPTGGPRATRSPTRSPERAPERAPERSTERAPVRWHPVAEGLATAEVTLRTPGAHGVAAFGRVRVVLARVEPTRFHWTLARGDGAWTVDDVPAGVALAFNAGQFDDAGPWGWVVHDGRERQAPGTGALAAALVVGIDGRVDVVDAAALDTARAAARRGRVREAVQSYPALLEGDGALPAALAAPGRGVDLAHRDARLAVGVRADGRLVVALTRFDAPALGRVPIGLTVPETAALMRDLGCRRAVLLDGGLSAQLRVGGAVGGAWRGLRAVPLGLVAARAPLR